MLSGRTARIGNHGLATSFFNDTNTDIATDLVKILLENNQDIPEFLESYKPEGELNFDEADSDEEALAAAEATEDTIGEFNTGDAWGAEGTAGGEGSGW
jgi:ATP-dependent RNA helicase DDX3X